MEVLKVKRLTQTAKLPFRATSDSAGCDLCADIKERLTVKKGEIVKIPCGIAIELPKNTAGFIFGRSGLGIKHGIVPANAVGVIDCDYRGEIIVGLINNGPEDYSIEPGERIAQLVVMPVIMTEIVESEDISDTMRGTGGFGSTGRVVK